MVVIIKEVFFMSLTGSIKKGVLKGVGKIVNSVAQNESSNTDDMDKTVTEGMPELLRKAGAESTVLLRNDNVLPLSEDETVSLFGRVQNDWFYVGYGSGGDVIKPYEVNLIDGLKNRGAKINEELLKLYTDWCEKNPADHGFWGCWPWFYPEMPIETDVINKAAENSDCAIISIGRASGEDRENSLKEGSYNLTEDEKSLIKRVTAVFKKTVIALNIGTLIDLSWINKIESPLAVLIPWQGGMESGNALSDVIFGDSEPGGRLTDTIAEKYEDYPSADNFGDRKFNEYAEDIYVGYRYFETFKKDAVLYPFGFGLSYTSFCRKTSDIVLSDDTLSLKVTSKNTGSRAGKDVIEVYAEAPTGVLGKAARVLCAFKKTAELSPDEAETNELSFPLYSFSSYDDSGLTGHKSCYVLEKGTYNIYVGGCVRSAEKVFSFEIPETRVIQELTETSAPESPFSRYKAKLSAEDAVVRIHEKTPVSTENLKDIILENLPESTPVTGDKGLKLSDVKDGKCTLDEFTAQLSEKELEAISRGDYVMNSPLGAKGNAGAIGGVLPSLRDKGVSPVITTDGPSGIRLKACCSLLPAGTAIASMWNTDLTFEIYKKLGEEMKIKGSDILLAPGMNIHRNPLCGRNFEYYSEDPVIAGKTAAAVVRGIQSAGVSACPKHFACNNQETNRIHNDSCVSERALREIYLKNFEICVKEGKPLNIMTSYNKINGVWGHYNYDLVTRILRKEWGYDGCVMTDWWMRKSPSPEFPNLKDNAYRVRAGVDVLMPGGERVSTRRPDGTLLKTLGKKDGITLGELQDTAKHVLKMVMALK